MNENEKQAKLELNRFIYGKQLSKDDIVEYISILFDLIDKQQKETEILKAIINKEHENNLDKRYVELKFISKDKIMEIAKEYIEDETIDLHGFYMKVMGLLGD